MIWKPAKGLGLIIGLLTLLTIVGIQVFLVFSMIGQRPSISMYFMLVLLLISIPLLVLWLYWLFELLSLRYFIDRNALIIEYGTARHVVPLGSIERIVHGRELHVTQAFRGVGWPGYLKGRQRIRKPGYLYVHSTEPLERQLIVITPTASYGISPANPDGFLEAYAARRALGAVRHPAQGQERARFMDLPLWHDRTFWAMVGLAIVTNLLLLGFIMHRYPDLPSRMIFHLNAYGQADRIAPKAWLLMLPGIGATTALVNTLLSTLMHRRERLAAHLLAGVAVAVQPILYIAATGILGR